MAGAKKARRKQNPVRYRAARDDASADAVTANIERDYGLPAGSVKLVYPSGRKCGFNIGTLRRYWDLNS